MYLIQIGKKKNKKKTLDFYFYTHCLTFFFLKRLIYWRIRKITSKSF